MHSHDNTLLSRLGFNDPDKSDYNHDLACRYLSDPATIRKIITILRPASNSKGGQFSRRMEMIISKGEGKYKTHIGFADVYLEFNESLDDEKTRFSDMLKALIEVKAGVCSVRECIRQLNLYQQYIRADFWVLATLWKPTAADVAELKNEGIIAIHIGDGFEKWKSSQSAPTEADIPSI